MTSSYLDIGVDPELVPRPERTPEIARRIQHHQVSLQQRPWAAGITALSPEQQELFAAVGLPVPTAAAL
jgi:hypothetical protein